MKKGLIETIKANKGIIGKRVLIIGAAVAALLLTVSLVKQGEEFEDDYDQEFENDEINEIES